MKIKICGITNIPDAKCVADNAADMIGFIFYNKSPRYVPPETVKEITGKIPDDFNTVGVFVNEPNSTMIEIGDYCGLKTLQLHGHESAEQVDRIRGFNIIKALPMNESKDLDVISDFKKYTVLIDTYGKSFGGTGHTINWDLAHRAAKSGNVMLAGGLTPENIKTAVQTVAPCGVDVSSGVETSKGIKDHAKIKMFIENIRDL